MNKERRAAIKKAIEATETIRDIVQNIFEEEQEAYDNMPDGVKESENGLISADAQESLEAAIDALEEAISCLEEVD